MQVATAREAPAIHSPESMTRLLFPYFGHGRRTRTSCLAPLIILGLITGVWLMTQAASAQTMKVLDNGMRVIHRQNTSNKIVAATCFIDVGSLYEFEQQKGLTSFVQDVILKGTQKRSAEDIAIETESLGISLGSDASDDFAWVSFSCIADDAPKAFEIFADVIFNPSFPPDEVEKERENILMNMRLSEDDSFYYTFKHFREVMFRGHPYALMPEGTPESIARIRPEELEEWHRTHYVPGNMILCVVGDISDKALAKMVDRHFAGQKGEAPPKMQVGKNFFPEYRAKSIEKEVEQSFVLLGYLAPDAAHQDWPALRVTAALLGDGMSSRLFRHLRDEMGLAYAVGTSLPARREQSCIIGYIGTKAESTKTAREEMLRQFRRLALEKVDEDELQRTKNYITGRVIMDHQRNSRQAWYLGWYELVGKGYQYDAQYTADIEAVTVEDVYRMANKYFTEPVVVQLEPTPGSARMRAGAVE